MPECTACRREAGSIVYTGSFAPPGMQEEPFCPACADRMMDKKAMARAASGSRDFRKDYSGLPTAIRKTIARDPMSDMKDEMIRSGQVKRFEVSDPGRQSPLRSFEKKRRMQWYE